MNADQARDLADICRMLGDPTRVLILATLSDGAKSVGSLCEKLKLPQPTVSHHLALLRGTGLAVRQRRGKEMYYQIDGAILKQVSKFVSSLK
jgi:ArsR family transcriptional regulator